MMINGLKVTKEDFEGLLRGLQTIKRLNDTNDRVALNNMLESLIGKLESNLVADEQRELQIHDKVEIISVEDEEQEHLIGTTGWIKEIDLNHEYPYSIGGDWLWKKENLKRI